MKVPLLLVFCAVLGVSGNLALRAGMAGFSPGEERPVVMTILWRLFTTPILWLGLAAYAASMVGWLRVLSTWSLSQAYPLFVSLSFLLLLTSSCVLLREPVRWTHIAGSGLILSGIWVCLRSAP